MDEEGEEMLGKPTGWFPTNEQESEQGWFALVFGCQWMFLYLSQAMNAKIQNCNHEGDCDKSALAESPEDQALYYAPLLH